MFQRVLTAQLSTVIYKIDLTSRLRKTSSRHGQANHTSPHELAAVHVDAPPPECCIATKLTDISTPANSRHLHNGVKVALSNR